MNIGNVIREYRKNKNMTQEQLGNYLGVTAPAVNKWEKGNSLPDVTLLAPIARILNISLDTLLSFNESLSEEEINIIVNELRTKFEESTYEVAFNEAKLNIEKYPTCYYLIWQLALLLDSWRIINDIAIEDNVEGFIQSCYIRSLASENEEIRLGAADALYHFFIRKDEYEKAEKYLSYFSNQNSLKKEKQAFIYSKTNREPEAYKIYEHLLLEGYQSINMILSNLYMLAQKENNTLKSKLLTEKQCELAKAFEMGENRAISPMLDYAVSQQDIELTIETMKKMMLTSHTLGDFSKSFLYQHLDFKEVSIELKERAQQNLKNLLTDSETFSYMSSSTEWEKLKRDWLN